MTYQTKFTLLILLFGILAISAVFGGMAIVAALILYQGFDLVPALLCGGAFMTVLLLIAEQIELAAADAYYQWEKGR